MTNKKIDSRIKSALRRVWLWSEERAKCLQNAKVKRGVYRCSACRGLFGRKEVQVNHITAIGKFIDWNTFVKRLFCEVNGLEVVCCACHKRITDRQRKDGLL